MTSRTLRIEALKLSARTRMNILGADSPLDRVIAAAAVTAAAWLERDRGPLHEWKEEAWRFDIEPGGILEELNKLDVQLLESLRLIYAETVVYSVRWAEGKSPFFPNERRGEGAPK